MTGIRALLLVTLVLCMGLPTGARGTAPAPSTSQAPGATPAPAEPAYTLRGREVERLQRTLRERSERLHTRLTGLLRSWAPDVLATLEPPPPGVYGYQILPRIIPDPPRKTGPRTPPQVVSYSWRWSETLLSNELQALSKLEQAVEAVLPAASSHDTLAAITTDYRRHMSSRRMIDADIDYNWLWQAAIAGQRPAFDAITATLEQARQQISRNEPLGADVVAAISRSNPPAYVSFRQTAPNQWLMTIPVSTDITDAGFVAQVKSGIEKHWNVQDGDRSFRLELSVSTVTPEVLYCGKDNAAPCRAPDRGAHIDLGAHAARFPANTIVITTGAASLRLVGGLVLSPHDVTPGTLAHEFGHLLGFPDAYFRGYRDLGPEGFATLEFVPDRDDIMSDSGTGRVLPRHYESLLRARGLVPGL
jgi:hypothetical protein